MTDEKKNLQWPIRILLILYSVSVLEASILLPSLDGRDRNICRLAMYGILSVVFWGRILVARLRKETGLGYILYVVMIVAAQFLIWPLVDWFSD